MKSLKDLLNYKSIIFDCDGVILQSNKIKTLAFRETLNGEPKHLIQKFINYHIKNGGISRYEKFQYYFSSIKRVKDSQKLIESNLIKYANLVRDQLVTVKYVPGLLDTLKFINENKIKNIVVSGGDQKELRYVFKKRKIFNRFDKILGSPNDKITHLENLISKKIISLPSIFFGDSLSDMFAAKKFNIEFCFVSQFSEWSSGMRYLDESSDYSIYNFNDL